MRYIINYFRQVFCKHDFLVEEGTVRHHELEGGGTAQKIYMRCKKCGYYKKHWKFI